MQERVEWLPGSLVDASADLDRELRPLLETLEPLDGRDLGRRTLLACSDRALSAGQAEHQDRTGQTGPHFPIAYTASSDRMNRRPPAIAGDASWRASSLLRARMAGVRPAESTIVSPSSLSR